MFKNLMEKYKDPIQCSNALADLGVLYCIHTDTFFAKHGSNTDRLRVAHLSDIATADMQMLCNIFPVLSSQLMKRSSFKQFFILKKKIYGMPVN